MSDTQPKRNTGALNRPIVLIGLAISLIFLWLAFRELQPQAFLESLTGVDVIWLIVAAATYFVAATVIAWRWQFLLRAVRFVALWPLMQIVAVGYMGNNVYPLRAGEALRIFLLKREHDIAMTQATTTVVVERVFDGIVMLSFLLLGVLLVDIQAPQIEQVAQVATPIFLLAVIVFFTMAAFPALLRRMVEVLATLLPERLAALVHGLADDIITGLSGLRSPLYLAGAVFASYATWAVEAVVYWMVMWAFGLDLGYPLALLVVGTVNLAGLIPASPGQFGVYEFFASAVMRGAGVADNTALAYAIVVHIVIWLPVTLAGFAALIRYGLGVQAITHAHDLEERSQSSLMNP